MPVLESFRVGVFGFLVNTSSPSLSSTTGSFGSASLRLAIAGIFNQYDAKVLIEVNEKSV